MKIDKKAPLAGSLEIMPTRSRRSRADKRVVGVGGIFFRAKKPKELSAWYHKHLGIKTQDNVALFTWQSRKNSKRVGYTVWSIFPHDSSYFRSKKLQFMINYRVKNLNKLLAELRREGVRVDRKVENLDYGKFGWVTDPEGNRIELWEPPRTYKAPEPEIPSE
jgi:predicted enzyme related to lactoylglutathione lyase